MGKRTPMAVYEIRIFNNSRHHSIHKTLHMSWIRKAWDRALGKRDDALAGPQAKGHGTPASASKRAPSSRQRRNFKSVSAKDRVKAAESFQ